MVSETPSSVIRLVQVVVNVGRYAGSKEALDYNRHFEQVVAFNDPVQAERFCEALGKLMRDHKEVGLGLRHI